jgi:hypothetical protein
MEDVPAAADAQEVIELPPEYIERLAAEPAPEPNQKLS